jgi:hypothetical protein
MRVPAAGLALSLAAMALAGCAAPGDGPAPLDGALDFLLAQREEGRWPAAFVPHMLEVANAANLAPWAWPEGRPLTAQFVMPPDNGSLLSTLRALYGATLVDDDGLTQEAADRVRAAYDGRQFGDPALLNDDAFALLVLASAHADFATEPARSMPDALLQNQSADHGWSWHVGGAGEVDMTGIVLTALSGARSHSTQPAPKALDRVGRDYVLHFLDGTRTPDGGHGLRAGGDAGNCDSTVWAIRSYALLGAPRPQAEWDFLLSLRNGDGGFAFQSGGPSNALCTAEVAVLLALERDGRLADPWA